MTDHQRASLSELYNSYLNIKPLIAEVETKYEQFPTPILNEIRAFNDHIARCYRVVVDGELIDKELTKAKSHIERVTLDLYKFLNVEFHKNIIRRFDRRTKGVDLSAISNGDFSKGYFASKKSIETSLKKAKSLEANDKDGALEQYESVYNKYSDLEDLIIYNERHICWARSRFYGRKAVKFLVWLAAAVISGVISSGLIPWDKIVCWG